MLKPAESVVFKSKTHFRREPGNNDFEQIFLKEFKKEVFIVLLVTT